MITNDRLFAVAVDYYEKGKTKSDIAKELGVSHVQVGKYLNLAKDRGLVEIVLNAPSVQPEEEEKMLKLFNDLYGLEELILVPGAASEKTTHAFIIDSLTRYILETFPPESLRFAIGMGRFIREIGDTKLKVVEKRPKWKIIPALNYDVQESYNGSYYDCLGVCEDYCRNWGVSLDKKYHDLITDFLNGTEDGEKKDGYYRNIDFVIGGVGVTFPRNPKLKSAFFKEEDLKKLKYDISGDYLNYYFDESGAVIRPITQGEYAMTIDEIMKVKKRIAVASGYTKIGSISSLLKTGMVNVLATDLPTARLVLSL